MRAITWSTLLLLPCVSVLYSNTAAAQDPATVDQCVLNLQVFMDDGASASGAIVQSIDSEGISEAVANASGEVVIRDEFSNGARLYARTADGQYQAATVIPAAALRSALASNVNLNLLPANTHEVTVLSNDSPVKGAQIAVTGPSFHVHGNSDKEGQCRFLLPANEPIEAIVAWHPTLGVDGIGGVRHGIDTDAIRLTLREPAPHTVCVIDRNENPVSGQKIGVNVRTTDSDWILACYVAAARTQTNQNGEATLPWIPAKELRIVDVQLFNSDWKIDEVNRDLIDEGTTTVRVRRLNPVTGRIKMPEGVSGKGLLVTGFGFGPYNRGHVPQVRAREDGTFAMRIPSAHGYVLGISDVEWSSELWSGIILGADTDEPLEIELEAYPATPLIVKVTRGSNREPVKGAWVHVKRRGRVGLIDSSGKPKTGNGSVRSWHLTDAQGIARAGLGKGPVEVRLSSGDWSATRKIEVESDEPVEMEFYRPWQGKRRLTARLTHAGNTYKPSSGLVARAWTEQSRSLGPIHKPKVLDDGTVEVEFDQPTISLLVIDRKKSLSGFIRVGPDDTSVEIDMLPTATYSGTMLDENGKPLADCSVRLVTTSSFLDVVEFQRTDEQGCFQFTGVAVRTPLRLLMGGNERGMPERFLHGSERLFEPGEERKNDTLQPRRMHSPEKTAGSTRSIAERIESTCQNTRVSNMRTLVILQGDDSGRVSSVTVRLTDDNETKPMLRFLPVIVSTAQLRAEPESTAQTHWPMPKPKEILLIVLDGHQQTVATRRIRAENVNAAVKEGAQFLEQQMLPSRDALLMLAEAKSVADSSDRRIWIVQGGPRCGPCFRLGRWIEKHHEVLEKDYVIVKLMGGIDENVTAIINKLSKTTGSGVPWHAIIEPDGEVLFTSDGPLGNIGMPGSIEGARYFRKMLEGTARRLSSDDIDKLMESLSPNRP